MPPRWPRKPDRCDPAFRQLDDLMNFATHVAAFLATNSGLWFFHNIGKLTWPGLIWITSIWLLGLVAHGLYIFAIADYSDPVS